MEEPTVIFCLFIKFWIENLTFALVTSRTKNGENNQFTCAFVSFEMWMMIVLLTIYCTSNYYCFLTISFLFTYKKAAFHKLDKLFIL